MIVNDPMLDSIIELGYASGFNRKFLLSKYNELRESLYEPFIDGSTVLLMDDDIGVFSKMRSNINGRRKAPVSMQTMLALLKSRELVIRAVNTGSEVDFDSVMMAPITRLYSGLHDYDDITHAIGLMAGSEPDFSTGAAFRLAELIGAAVYRMKLNGVEPADALTSIPVFDKSIIQLAILPTEYAVSRLMALI